MAAEASCESDDDFSAAEKKSLTNPKGPSSSNKNLKEEWKRSFCFLSYRNFLLHTRSTLDKQTAKDSSSTQNETAEDKEDYGLYADDKGYLQGEIYEELESDEEIGFTGDLAQELNLMPPSDEFPSDKYYVAKRDHGRTLQDSELEIAVVRSARFIREISDGKHK